ncbi:hypothetical protein GQE99_04180 [Maritimibacter sp. DP07]|uniref:Uncharacterized protein n=1 Tax=Maritimibacter harenae TaxID=2606218 RepID=A0A845LW96_9RHOB|nr:hypothetical protein [Maritimibacter harenae]MZR12210.1 hypothetical protein [Maritimibacter harenae]
MSSASITMTLAQIPGTDLGVVSSNVIDQNQYAGPWARFSLAVRRSAPTSRRAVQGLPELPVKKSLLALIMESATLRAKRTTVALSTVPPSIDARQCDAASGDSVSKGIPPFERICPT